MGSGHGLYIHESLDEGEKYFSTSGNSYTSGSGKLKHDIKYRAKGGTTDTLKKGEHVKYSHDVDSNITKINPDTKGAIHVQGHYNDHVE